jgi:hypothetical protein
VWGGLVWGSWLKTCQQPGIWGQYPTFQEGF